jgi:hypothetical protein
MPIDPVSVTIASASLVVITGGIILECVHDRHSEGSLNELVELEEEKNLQSDDRSFKPSKPSRQRCC